MNTTHRIDELIVDLSFQRDTGADAPVDEELLRVLVIDKLLPALDQVLSQHADDGAVWKIDHLEIDLGDIPEQELASELPMRLQDRVRRALADLSSRPAAPAARTGVRTIPRATADADFLKRYLRDGRFSWRAGLDQPAPYEMALDRLLNGAAPELFSFLRHAPMRQVFARRLAQQFPQRQLHALLRYLVPASDADQLLRLVERFEQLLSRSEADGAAHRNMLRLLWQYVLDLALHDGAAVHAFDARMPAPPGLRSAAARLRLAGEAPANGLAAQLLNRLAVGAAAAAAVHVEEVAGIPDHEARALADDEVIVRKLTQALLQADTGQTAQWQQLFHARAALRREAMYRIGANAGAWRRIAAAFPRSLLDEMTAVLAPEAAAALQPLITGPISLESARGATGSDAHRQSIRQLWVISIMHLLRTKTATFDAGRYADALLDHMAGQDNIRRRMSSAAWLDGLSAQRTADGAGDAVARALSAALALPGPHSSSGEAGRRIDADAASASLPDPAFSRQPGSAPVADAIIGQSDSDVVEALALPPEQQAARLQLWLSQLRSGGRSVAAHRWTVEQLQRLINAVAVLDSAGRHEPMLQVIALHAPRVRHQHRYFALALEQLVRGAPLDPEEMIARCNGADEDRGMPSPDGIADSRTDQAPRAAALPLAGVAALRLGIVKALAEGAAALQALYREQALPRHSAQTGEFSGNASILYQLAAALVEQQADEGGADRSMLLRAVAAHARRSTDAARYLRCVLEDLALEREVDLDAIDARIARDQQPHSAERNSEPESAADQIVEHMVQALLNANPAILYPHWDALQDSQAPALREALHRVGARIAVWRQVAAAFPASLLERMTALLAPEAASALRPMMKSKALFESAGGTAIHGSMPQWAQQLWSASFMHLLALKRTQFSPDDYATALLSAMAGSDQVRYYSLAVEWRKALLAEPVAGMHSAATVDALSALADQVQVRVAPSTNRAEMSPAPDKTLEHSHIELAEALDLPAEQQETWLEQWLLRARTDHRRVMVSRLTVEQLQRLINAVAALDNTGRHEPMRQAIALHAPRARSQQRYFALVVEQLVRGALLDLEEIVAQCNARAEDHDMPAMQETAGKPADQRGRSGVATLPSFDANRFDAGQIHPGDAMSIRERVVQALSSANAASLYPNWDALRRTHTPDLLHALHQIGAQINVWQRIAAAFPTSLLDEMTTLLAPEAASALRPLMVRPAWLEAMHGTAGPDAHRQSARQLWVASVMHLLGVSTVAFDAGHYIDVLLDRMAGQGAAQRRAMASAWQDAISAQESAAGESSDAVARALSEWLALQEPSVCAASTKRGTDAGAKSADGLHEVRRTIADAVAREDHAALKSLLQSLPPAGPALELPGLSGDAVILHWLINSFVTAAAGGADRGTLLQAIASHVARSANQTRYLLHVLRDLVHDRIIDLDAIEELCTEPANESAQPETAVRAAAEPAPERASQAGQGAGPLPAAIPPRRSFWLAQALAAHPPAVRAALSPLLYEAEAATSVDQLPQTLLRKVVALLAGADERAMQRQAWDVADIFAQRHPGVAGERIDEAKWQFLFSWLFEQQRRFDPSRFSYALADHLTSRTGVASAADMSELLQRRLGVEPLSLAELPALPNAPAPYPMPEPAAEDAEEIYVGNAGQVLAAPYMPRLFAMLNLTEGGRFKNDEAAERAVHLLQFMTSGQTDCPEYQLGLNKILCGVKAGQPIVREIEIDSHEKEVVEALIKAMIEHWKVVGNTSIDGLRESFLQRPGSLHMKDDAWYLTVQGGAFDMLLDRLPWSFSIIKHPWMERAVHVTWR